MRHQKMWASISLLVIALALLALFWPKSTGSGFLKNIKLGLDISGGVRLEYKVVPEEEVGRGIQEVVDDVWMVLRRRLDDAGYTEAVLRKAYKEDGAYVIVEIPEATSSQEAEKLIGSTGILYFAEVLDVSDTKPPVLTSEWKKGADGKWYRVNPNIGGISLKAPKIRYATPEPNTREGGWIVIFALANAKDIEKFRQITERLYKRRLAIILDQTVEFAGIVEDVINNGQAVIRGNFSLEEAKNLAAILKSGALPARLELTYSMTVAPLLGKDIINASIKAGIWGIVVVMVYMILFYGVMGVVADIAILYNTFLLLGILAATKAILTLPGIAGIILTIGTTVDGNIIIYERIKEEIRNGKPVRAAINAGFSRSTVTLLDANLTTIITALVLYYFGVGTIRSFATTLIIGILGSLFVNLVVSRLMLHSFAGGIKVKKAEGGAKA